MVSVTVRGSGSVDFDAYEYGDVEFRVSRVLAGPPLREVALPYFYWLEPDPAQPDPPPGVGSDWAGEWSPWPARPKVGERLLLLLPEEHMAVRPQGKSLLDAVRYRWEVGGDDDPLVDGFAVAGKFLAARDEATRDGLYKQLCESPLRNMRTFARDAAFAYLGWEKGDRGYDYFGKGYDPERQCRLALLFLKHAGPRLGADERMEVTHAFAFWFREALKKGGITDDVTTAFEDWYLTEFAVRDDLRRPAKALEELDEVAQALGTAATVALFKKSGRDGLLERVRECSRSPDPAVERHAKALLAKLEKS